MKKLSYSFLSFLLVFFLLTGCGRSPRTDTTENVNEAITGFKVDPFWPEPLPDNWLLGQVSGVAVDQNDHIWIIHRPNTLGVDEAGPRWESLELPYEPAPPVIEFDKEGNVIQAWGGPSENFDWPEGEHGIFVDHEKNVWICAAYGRTDADHQVLKFKSDGTFLLQIGESGETGGSNDTALLGRPTDIAVDADANEVYISDGYLNRRIIVFDSNTGEYKRHWGAYGNKPDDSEQDAYDPGLPPPQQFNIPHAVGISNDGLVYVCDRTNNRIQVFQKDGEFLFEKFVAKNTGSHGSTWDLDFSPDPEQKFIYVADGTNQCVWVLDRESLEVSDNFGRIGRYAGQFIWVHSIATDSEGNIYTGEVFTGKRAQKFNRSGN